MSDEEKFNDFIHLNMARMDFLPPDKVILTDFGWKGSLWAYREIKRLREAIEWACTLEIMEKYMVEVDVSAADELRIRAKEGKL